MTSTWRSLALVFPETDARYGRFGRQRCRRTMSRPEITAIRRVLRMVPAAVNAWSEGNVRLRPFDVRMLERPLTSLSDAGGGRYWPAPADAAEVIAEHAGPGEFDSVFVIWPSDGDTPLCGWGCTYAPTPEAQGAGYSAIVNDDWWRYAEHNYPEEGFVHEWLHQVESAYRTLGVGEDQLPGLHDVEGRTSARGDEVPPFGQGYVAYHAKTNTWQPWYRDLMTGTVGPKGTERGPLGLTPELCARRGR
jgi:hypothetical protein